MWQVNNAPPAGMHPPVCITHFTQCGDSPKEPSEVILALLHNSKLAVKGKAAINQPDHSRMETQKRMEGKRERGLNDKECLNSNVAELASGPLL